jgi:hypothetical protein
VLFDFNTRYGQLIEQQTGIKVPQVSATFPSTWNWERELGVTKQQEKELWNEICGELSYSFWRYLPAYEWSREFLAAAAEQGELVFVTSRCGKHCVKATTEALEILGVTKPRVIIAHNKAPVLIAEQITDFIDDRDKNFEDCLNDCTPDSPSFEMWLMDQPWNQHFESDFVIRITNPMQML